MRKMHGMDKFKIEIIQGLDLESTTFALTRLSDIQVYGVQSKEILTHVRNNILNS